MNLITVTCYNCGCPGSRLYDSENGFQLRKCEQCGLLYVNPRPPDGAVDDAARTGTHRGERVLCTTGAYLESKELRLRRALELVFNGSLPEGSWLDIGAGFGELLAALQALCGSKLSVVGLEPNSDKVLAAQARGLPVELMEGGVRARGRFDYVSALNVYSHLPDPVQTIREWADLLRPGGQILLQTGDTSNLPPWRHPRPYSLPDHLSFASEPILRNVLEKIGLHVTAVVRRPLYPAISPLYRLRQIGKKVIGVGTPNFGWVPWNPHRDLWILAQRRT
ncbi:MAG TPA: class I SAM-dependent methyltransferase [Verrucomicrobiae bacterium]|nr:class I SAM-dependent methyltransferase [Verrucomicrobiae bacterium]